VATIAFDGPTTANHPAELDDPDLLREWYWGDESLSHQAIADRLGCAASTVQQRFAFFGIPTRRTGPRPIPQEVVRLLDDAEWCALQQKIGRSHDSIATQLRVSRGFVSRKFREHGITSRPGKRLRECNQRKRRARIYFAIALIVVTAPLIEQQELKQHKAELKRRKRYEWERQHAARAKAEGKCRDCNQPLDDESSEYVRCKKCRRRRQSHEGLGRPQDACEPPDPTPAITCRETLQDARAHGVQFPEAWLVAFQAAMATVTGGTKDRKEWSAALYGSEEEWRRCYERTGVGLKLTASMINGADSGTYQPLTVIR